MILVNNGLLVLGPSAAGTKKGGENFMSCLQCHTQFAGLFPTWCAESDRSFPELHDLQALRSYMNGNPARTINASTMLKFLDEASVKKAKRGKEQAAVAETRKQYADAAAKLRSAEDNGKLLLEKLSSSSHGQDGLVPGASSPPRRKMRKESPQDQFVTLDVEYYYTPAAGLRTRRQSVQ